LRPGRRRAHGVPARETVGRTVGFRTRLETRVSRETRIEVVTGAFLPHAAGRLGPHGIGCVIFDEFHERS